MVESAMRSHVESSKAPHGLPPFADIRAIVPSKRSLNEKMQIAIVPQKKWPFGYATSEVMITKKEPIAVTKFGVKPIFKAKRQAGVMNLVTGALNGICNIVPIVG